MRGQLKKISTLPPGTVYMSKKGRGKRRVNPDRQDVCFDCGKPGRHGLICEYKLNPGKYKNEGRRQGGNASQVHPPQVEVTTNGEDAPQAQATTQADAPGAIPSMDKDDGFVSDFLTRSWEEREATLPSLYNLRPKEPLDRSKWPSWKYTLPDVSLNFGSLPDPDALLFGGCDVHVWCPFTFYSHLIDVGKLSCPACGSHDITSDGWSKSFLPIVSLGGQWPLLRVRRLRHLGCNKAAKNADSTSFSSLDETLVASWYPAAVLSLLPFRMDGKRYVSLDATTYAREMQQIASYDAASDVLGVVRDMWLQRRQKALLELVAMECKRDGALGLARVPVRLKMLAKPKATHGLSGKVLRRIGVNAVKRLHGYIEDVIAAAGGEVLKIDHTFKVASAAKDADGTKPYTSMFTVMNQTGMVIGFYFCETKSLKEIEPELQKLAKRLASKGKVKVIYTDNPGADEAILKKLFGAGIHVKKDIWHTMDKYYKALYKHPLRSWFMGELSNCFFSYDEKDVKELRRHLRASCPEYSDDVPLEALPKDNLRRYIVNPSAIKENLRELIDRYSDIKGLFKKSMDETQENAFKDLDAGFLHDPEGVKMYYNIGTKEKPRYVTVRSTSQLENLHRVLRNCVHGARLSLTTMHSIIMDRIFRWNLMKHKRHATYDGPRLLDPNLVMQIKALLHELPPTCRPTWADSLPTMTLNTGDETFGVLREETASAALHAIKAAGIVPKGKSFEVKRTRIPEVARKVKTESEKRLFKYLMPRCHRDDDDYATPADNWNRLLVSWWLRQSAARAGSRHHGG
ncbi:hypothetical protein SDRG_02244 [Saprolegnia diclina VS20]|uniref:Uncharacterized protein n=1 Tax=Saprolegnia diclina (strain VS20) TaxID=1156394 RepID=T0S5A3_SAPDV|nr:hypothetical protein SDRG_02244 [Saprolegnia diclina VS20]EQC40343.1 hypothetical protein SDRG_02244 [Saprolegnia diclina VS20]|eukprot:XP_008606042.1 hypothetical protein SDRG_02244 [Saprolegnia diclina VS20]